MSCFTRKGGNSLHNLTQLISILNLMFESAALFEIFAFPPLFIQTRLVRRSLISSGKILLWKTNAYGFQRNKLAIPYFTFQGQKIRPLTYHENTLCNPFYIQLTYHFGAENFRQELSVCYDLENRTNDSSSFFKNSVWAPPGVLTKIISNTVVFKNKDCMN